MLEIIGYGIACMVLLFGLMPVFLLQTSTTAGDTTRAMGGVVAVVSVFVAGGLVFAIYSQAQQARDVARGAQAVLDAAHYDPTHDYAADLAKLKAH